MNKVMMNAIIKNKRIQINNANKLNKNYKPKKFIKNQN